jgi:hypothetical protein
MRSAPAHRFACSLRGDSSLSRDPGDYIDHIRESTTYIETWVAEGRERFFGDVRTQAAVIRKLHELSESIKRLRAIVGDRYTVAGGDRVSGRDCSRLPWLESRSHLGHRYDPRPSIEAAHCAHRDRPSRLNVPEEATSRGADRGPRTRPGADLRVRPTFGCEESPQFPWCARRNVSGLLNTLAIFIPLRTALSVTFPVASAAPSWMYVRARPRSL